MEQDFDKLKSEMEAKVKESFELAPFFHHNLNNFAYRYFDLPSPSEELEGNLFMVSGIETKLKNALKTEDSEIKAGVTELAKSVPFKDGPAVQYSLSIKVEDFDASRGGNVRVSSQVNWNFPSFETEKGKLKTKTENFKFEDILILRNKLAKILESACELFPGS